MKHLKIFFITLISILSFFVYNNTFASLSISPLKFEFEIDKNSSKKEKIKITNDSETAITIYSSEEDFTAWDDTWTPKFIKPEEQDNPSITLANWIKVEDENLTLAPWESKEVNFTINVPKTAEPGWHYAAIFFSPWVPNWWQVAIVQRLWVLILVNVPWEVSIKWDVKSFKIWKLDTDKKLSESDSFVDFPIIFQTVFENAWNVHLKPNWKITLIDEDWEILKNIWKESITSPAWAYIWEKMVDYIPVNDWGWNVLPKSERRFETPWEWFWYSILNEDGTKSVKFKNLTEYYADKASEKAQYLMFWQAINTRKVSKKITAKFELAYEWKDKEKKDFLDSKDFKVTYEEKYVWVNYYVVGGWVGLILLVLVYFIIIAPKQRRKREEELKRKIMEEMNK